MQDQPQSFAFALMPAEIAQITPITVVGPWQAFHQILLDKLASGDVVTLDCRELGELIWHISRSESEFQIRLRRAFIRSLYALLAIPIDRSDLLR